MSRLLRSFGPHLTILILLLSGVWVTGMMIGPLLVMVEQSFCYTHRGADGVGITLEITNH